jgi:ABC-2 type transport system permease protein
MDKRLIRIGGFVTKEITEVVRQPRLVLSLILGPFVIMLLFGVGYVGELGVLDAVLVVPPGLISPQEIQAYRQEFATGNIHLVDITTDQEDAIARLRAEEVDVVVVLPAHAAQQIGAGGQAELLVLYNTIDPMRSGFIVLVTVLYSNDLNKRIVAQAVERSQGGADDVDRALRRVDDGLAQAQARLAQHDRDGAPASVQEVPPAGSLIGLHLEVLLAVLQTEPIRNTSAPPPSEVNNLTQGRQVAARLSTDLQALGESLRDPESDPSTISRQIVAARRDISDLRVLTRLYGTINPYVLAAPLYGKAENLAPIAALNTSPTVFYVPGAIALLLQHLAITISALSMVRERQFGRFELFRVTPITPGEILTGKYIGFSLFAAIVALALVLLVTLGLGVPVLGSVAWLAVVLGLLIWSSLGIGFIISIIAHNQNQAVQLSMITLLGSVFFSGLFVRIDYLAPPLRALSYLLPATHALITLQDVMLKGFAPVPIYLGALAALGAVFALISMWRVSAEFRRG